MAERRKHPRIRARFPCDLRFGENSIKATVRDLSEGGLSILADLEEPKQGEPARLTLYPPSHPDVEVACVFWHCRRIRVVGEERWTAHLGFVLSAVCDPYFALVQELRDRALLPTPRPQPSSPAHANRPQQHENGSGGKTRLEIGALARVENPVLRQFCVRVKEEGGPRTVRMVVAARDHEDAVERALAEAGCNWVALEAKRA